MPSCGSKNRALGSVGHCGEIPVTFRLPGDVSARFLSRRVWHLFGVVSRAHTSTVGRSGHTSESGSAGGSGSTVSIRELLGRALGIAPFARFDGAGDAAKLGQHDRVVNLALRCAVEEWRHVDRERRVSADMPPRQRSVDPDRRRAVDGAEVQDQPLAVLQLRYRHSTAVPGRFVEARVMNTAASSE